MASVSRTHWFLLAAAVGGVSVSSILVRYAQAQDVPSLVISFYRLLFSTAMLAPFALWQVHREGFVLHRGDLSFMAGVGLMLAAHFATWVTSLEYTSVASSAVIVTTESLWVPLGAMYLLREHVGARVWAGVLVAFGGGLLLVAGDFGETRFGGRALLGDMLAFAGALAASLYFLAGRRLRQRYTLLTYATLVYAFSTAFLGLMVLARGESLWPYSTTAFGFLFLFAFFPMILGHTLINYLLKWIPPHYVSTSILAEPVVSAVLALVLLQEAIGTLVLVGGLIILTGIVVATSQAAKSGPEATATA